MILQVAGLRSAWQYEDIIRGLFVVRILRPGQVLLFHVMLGILKLTA